MPQSAGPSDPDERAVPHHVAIIMDGNGRWAKARGKPRVNGHRAGAETVRKITRAAADLGVEVLSLYAFSAENWKRPRAEVSGLFRLLDEFLKKFTGELVESGVRLRPIGRLDGLPGRTQKGVAACVEATAGGGRMTLAIALNYASQDEVVDAARALAREAVSGRISPEDIGRHEIEDRLYTAGLPPVDLLIRTGGEKRLSNFLLWQAAYAELLFTPVLWPDFGRPEFEDALAEFARRDRRYGGI